MFTIVPTPFLLMTFLNLLETGPIRCCCFMASLQFSILAEHKLSAEQQFTVIVVCLLFMMCDAL